MQEQKTGPQRLSRYLAHAGLASRRGAEELIAAGRVVVNGTVVQTQGFKVDPDRDTIVVDGRPVEQRRNHVYIALHKPTGFLSTSFDPHGRKIVLDLFPQEIRRQRIYPVGRLDYDTSGLLFLTNDGDFSMKLSHPRYGKTKEYQVQVPGHPSEEALNVLRRGVSIIEDDGTAFLTQPAHVEIISQSNRLTWLQIELQEGRKRQIRRMLEIVGHPVQRLIRVRIGSIELGELGLGQWRYLTEEEVQGLLSSGRRRRSR